MVELFYEDTPDLLLDKNQLYRWLSVVCELEQRSLEEVSIIFCSDDYLLDVNKEHLNHDFYTDIITFSYSEDQISGDLFISVDRVRENATTFGVSFLSELHRVVVHGVLHLLGYDDKTDHEAQEMRNKEDAALKLIVPRET